MAAVLLASAAALLVSGTAFAAPPVSLEGGPVQIRGHTMTLSVFPEAGIAGSARLGIKFSRKFAGGTEENDYAFVEGVTFRAKASLSAARLSADLGSFGKIALRFHRSRRAGRTLEDPSCRPKFDRSRGGILRGVFELKTRTRLFGTVRLRSISAKLGSRNQRCIPRPQGVGSQFRLGNIGAGLDDTREGAILSAQKLLDGTVTQRFSVWKHSLWKIPRATHTIDVRTPASVFTVSPDFSTARVDGIAPRFIGNAHFTATDAGAGIGGTGQARGTLTGNLEAHFDSIGKVRIFPAGSVPGFLAVCELRGCPVALNNPTG